MWAIIKKEVKSYFLSPVGYVFIGLFLLMASVFFYLDIIRSGLSNYEYMFYSLSTILTFITPILIMRMFAEERKEGTEQLLFTSPRSLTEIVLGKFFAAVMILVISEIFTLFYFVILTFFGNPQILTALTALFWLFIIRNGLFFFWYVCF